ncbi:CHRD domain-containing protein [Bradyrhizobium sp. CCBAU 53415]|uniref:CHRD domain-containing protein n=1 Tax=Bradyrhizobium sp. CCBAU 53415 TaxID=1325119 RepID=UPI003FA4304B
MGAHIHSPGEAGRNAGIVLPFDMRKARSTQCCAHRRAGGRSAGPKMAPNIHAAANPGGELRGRMTKQRPR